MSTARTIAQRAAAHYRLVCYRALKRGQPVPGRETHISNYLARNQQAGEAGMGEANATRQASTPPPPVQPGRRDSGNVSPMKVPDNAGPDETPSNGEPETPIEHVERCEVCHWTKANCNCNRGY